MTMDVPTYEDLLLRYEVDNFCMKQTFRDEHLVEVGSQLDKWETLAWHIGIPTSEIENIKRECNNEVKGIQLLQCWKRGCGFKATYKALVILLLKINRADLAGKVVALRKSVVQRIPSPPRGVKETLQKFEKEFLDLIIFIEATLKESNVQIDTIIRRFSMLPQSIRRRFQTDENYKETKQRILDSNTVKKLFDNLTELKHWNYMMPDTLVHILEDVKNDDMHKKVDEYKDKLTAFKANTKLRELIGISFPVPDYCMELTMEVEGWEDKTIQEVENRAVNIIRRAAYSGSPRVSLGWKGVVPGCIEVSFILMESIQPSPEKLSALCEVDGVMYISIDGDVVYMEQMSLPDLNWIISGTVSYVTASKGLNVLIIAPDMSLPHPDAVARRSGQLTEEDKLKLQSQGLPPDCQDELAIVKTRCELDRKLKVTGVKSGKILREEAIKHIACLLRTTNNDGASIYYIGAGRRGTGDWCFEDGFITFRDIAQLYLSASHNFKGRVLSIVSDCSYSGCWVKDCMEFLDEQGVQPCGHKAREKGMIIKMLASCKSNEIPTKYRYSVDGMDNDENTGEIGSFVSTQLLETQTTNDIDSSQLNCSNDTIDDTCTLESGYTWKKFVQFLEYNDML